MGHTRKVIILFLLTFTFYLLSLTNIISPSIAAQFKEIQERGYIKIAVKDNLHPFGFKDADGNLQGFEIDIAQRLAQDLLGKKNASKLQPVTNRQRLPFILNNKVDMTIARVTATPSRARLVNFSVPYYLDGTLLVTKDTSLQRLSDFAKRKIAVLKNSSTIARVRYFLPNSELVGVNSYQEALSLLEKNGAEAFAADGGILSSWLQQNPQYRLLTTPLSTEPLSVVLAKGLQHDELFRKVNLAIAGYLESGWLKERAKYWGLPSFELEITK